MASLRKLGRLSGASPTIRRTFSRGFANQYNFNYKRMLKHRKPDNVASDDVRERLGRLSYGNARAVLYNNVKARNAIDLKLLRGFIKRYKAYDLPSDMIAWFIRSKDDKFFCPGPNFQYFLKEGGRIEDPENLQYYIEQFYKETQGLAYITSRSSKPAVVFINGYVGDMGVALGFHGRTTFVGPEAVLTHNQTARGWFPDAGLTYMLPRLETASLGMFLGLTGHKLQGYDIVRAGYVDHYTHPPHLDALFQSAGDARDFEGFWDAFHTINTICVDEADTDLEEFQLEPFMDRIEKCFDQESIEQIYEQLEQQGEWGQEIIQTLNTKCPTSLKLSHRLIREGASMSLKQCLEQEYRCALNMMNRSDFNSGIASVKGVIHGRDASEPISWFPNSLNDIGDAEIKTLMSLPFGRKDIDFDDYQPFIPPNEVVDAPPFVWHTSNRASRQDGLEAATERNVVHTIPEAKQPNWESLL